MRPQRAVVDRFSGLVAQPPGEIDLAEAALLIAAGAYPDLDVNAWLRALDRLAAGVSDLEGLRARLFSELGLRGDAERYYDPDNSFLHRVLQRRRGIPISLSVLTMEVGRRAGVVLQGIGMPGHFLMRAPAEALYLDPFDGGAVLDEFAMEALFRSTTGAGADVAFSQAFLPVVDSHEILTRMLSNLRSLYRATGSATDLEWVLRMRLALPDPTPTEAIELGEALAAQGRFHEAANELDTRATTNPILHAAANALRARLN